MTLPGFGQGTCYTEPTKPTENGEKYQEQTQYMEEWEQHTGRKKCLEAT